MFLFFLIATFILLFIIVILIIKFRHSFAKKRKLFLAMLGLLLIISVAFTVTPLFISFPSADSAYQLLNMGAKNHAIVYGEKSAMIIMSNEQQYGFTLENNQWKISNPYFGTKCIGKTHWIGNLIGSVTKINGDNGVYLVLSGVETSTFTTDLITDSVNSNFKIIKNQSFFTMATYINEWTSNYTLYIDDMKMDISELTEEIQKSVQINDNQFYTLLLNGIFIAVVVVLVIRKMVKNKKKTTNS